MFFSPGTYSTTFAFALFCLQDERSVILDRISERIDTILPKYLSVNFQICGDLNVQHKELLVYWNKTDEEGRYYRAFSIAYELTQNIEESTQFWIGGTTVEFF